MSWGKTPLAWLIVTRDRVRLLVAVCGIAFACVLMFVQLGFQEALYEGSVRPHRSFDADLVMVNPHFETFFSTRSFPRTRLYQCLSMPEVESVSPVYVGKAMWRNPLTRVSRDILVFGFNPLNRSFNFEGLSRQTGSLKSLNRVLFDAGSRPEYGPIESMLVDGPVVTEVNQRQIVAVGTFRLGASFVTDGNLLASESTFMRLFPSRHAGEVDVGLIKLKEGADAQAVQRRMSKRLSGGVMVLTMEQFSQRERQYWANSTGIGFIFGLGVVVGFIVGVVIVYQILHSDVSDHLSEYATLKAMGYTDRFLLSIVMQEALILAIAGYIPGVLVSIGVYEIAQQSTLLPIFMTPDRALLVFLLSSTMCAISGVIATKKLSEADPAEIF